jgi:hypothetical protein
MMTTEDMCATKWPPAWGSVREVLGHPTHVSKVPVNGGLFSTMRRVDFTNVAARPVRDGRSPGKQDVGWELMRLPRLLKVLSIVAKVVVDGCRRGEMEGCDPFLGRKIATREEGATVAAAE